MATDNNKLYYGDNLDVLWCYVKDESEDLIYLDPPFNSRKDHNVLFAGEQFSVPRPGGCGEEKDSGVIAAGKS